MRMGWIAGVLLVYLCTGVSTSAWAAEVTTWDDCIKLAQANHPDLLAAQARVKQAEADLRIAYSNWFPQADVDASVRKSSGDQSPETTNYSASVNVRQLLFDGFQTPGQVGRAQLQLNKAQNQYDQVAADLRYSLRQAYVELLKSGEMLSLTQTIMQRRKQNLSLVKLRYQAGREHAGSLLTAEADLGQAQFEAEQAQRNHDLSKQKLSAYLGVEDAVSLEVSGSFQMTQDISAKPDIRALMEQTPAVQENKADVEIAHYGVQLAYAEFYPSLNLSASAGLQDDHWLPEQSSLSAGLSLSWPLFTGGSRLASVAKADAALVQAEKTLASQKDKIRLDLEQSWKAVMDAKGQADVQILYLKAAQARAKIVNAQYSSGLTSFDDWSIIEDKLVSTQKAYLNAQAQLLSAEAQWDQSKGVGFNHE